MAVAAPNCNATARRARPGLRSCSPHRSSTPAPAYATSALDPPLYTCAITMYAAWTLASTPARSGKQG